MNIKKSIFHVIAFIFIINAQVVYTKENEDDNNNKSQSAITVDQNDTLENMTQYDEEMWKIIQETYQAVTDQTQKIEFCLQQIEQIINAGKISFDNKTLSKSQILKEIKDVKLIIKNIFEYYTTQLVNKDEAMAIGTCFNTAFIGYLLPVFQNDIKTINLDDFKTFVAENSEKLMGNLQDPAQLPAMIEKNDADLKILITTSDYVGLSTFNKVYRYLDTKPLPFYGKSTLATAQDVAVWGGAALLAYSMIVYGLSENTSIYGSWTKFDPTSEEMLKLKKECPEKFKAWVKDNVQTEANGTFWMEKGTQYRNWKVKDLPGKSFIGDFHRVEQLNKQNLSEDVRSEVTKNLGLFGYVHDATNMYTSTFTTGIVAALGWLVKKPLLEAYESTKKSFNYAVNYYLKGDITTPKNSNEVTKTYFNEMIGGDHLEKLARELTDFLKNPTRYERAGISPSTGYLLVGPPQTGKSFFAKALKTMVDEAFEGTNEKVKFAIITADDLQYFGGFTDIFYWARKNAPIILFIDEIDMFGMRRDKNPKNTQELLTAMNGIETDPSKKVIVIAATNKPEELEFALKQKGRLGNVITFDYPTYECRKAYLEKQLLKKNIVLHPEMIETIAQETDRQTYNMIDDIVRQALQLATFQTRSVEEADFEITLDREIRKIKPNTTMSSSEKELVAIYQAGQSAARHILKTDQQIVKITINTVDKPMKSNEGVGVINEQKGEQHENHELLPQIHIKATRLGFVFTMSKTNNLELISDIDQEKELMALLSGQAALELIKGTTFNGFGKEDRAKVLEALEKKISQGTPITDAIRQQAIAAKDILYQQAKGILQNHIGFITSITNELLQHNTINTKQWVAIAANYTV